MNDERLHTIVGLILLPLVAIGVVLVLWLGQRPLRPVVDLEADFERVGQLKPGARVLMANLQVGKVKHISFVQVRDAAGHARRRVRVYFYVERRYARQVWTNSPAYVSSMSLIGERHLEIDAPPAKPARLVRSGDVLQGRSPSHMDRLLQLGYESLVATSELTKAVAPHWLLLRKRMGSLDRQSKALKVYRDRAERLAERARLVVTQARQTVQRLRAVTRDGRAFRQTGRRLQAFGDRTRQGVRPLADGLDRLVDRLQKLARLVRERVPGTVKLIRSHVDRITSRFHQIERWISIIRGVVTRGDGTIGAFMQEKELWDDFKISGRVIRQEIWRTIARPKKTSVKGAPGVP